MGYQRLEVGKPLAQGPSEAMETSGVGGHIPATCCLRLPPPSWQHVASTIHLSGVVLRLQAPVLVSGIMLAVSWAGDLGPTITG